MGSLGGIITETGTTKKTKTGAWWTFKPEVTDKCIKCLTCTWYCPEGSITGDRTKGIKIDYDYCKGCGICAQVCPVKAIKMDREKK